MIYIFLIFILVFGCGWVVDRKRLERMFSKKKYIESAMKSAEEIKVNCDMLPAHMRKDVYISMTAFALIFYGVTYIISFYYIEKISFLPFILIALVCDLHEVQYLNHRVIGKTITDLQETILHAASIYRKLLFLYIAIQLLITIF